jgi:hypothetical protein
MDRHLEREPETLHLDQNRRRNPQLARKISGAHFRRDTLVRTEIRSGSSCAAAISIVAPNSPYGGGPGHLLDLGWGVEAASHDWANRAWTSARLGVLSVGWAQA